MIFESNGERVVAPDLPPTTPEGWEARNMIDSYDSVIERYLALKAQHDAIRRKYEEMPPAATLAERVDRLFAMHDAIDHATMNGILHLVSGASYEESHAGTDSTAAQAPEEAAAVVEAPQPTVEVAQAAINGITTPEAMPILIDVSDVGHPAVHAELEADLPEGAPVSTDTTLRVSAPTAPLAAQA